MERPTLEQIGENIRTVRQARRMSQLDLARKACTSQAAIGRYEQGKSDMLVGTLLSIASALDFDAAKIISGKRLECKGTIFFTLISER